VVVGRHQLPWRFGRPNLLRQHRRLLNDRGRHQDLV